MSRDGNLFGSQNAHMVNAYNGQETSELKSLRDYHPKFIGSERLEYMKKTVLANCHSRKYLSFSVDGAYQTKLSRPHFVSPTKEQRGHGIFVHLIGVLQRAPIITLRLFTTPDENATGSNDIVKAIHRSSNDMRKTVPLSSALLLQIDSCCRENQNRYFMAYVEALVRWESSTRSKLAFYHSAIPTPLSIRRSAPPHDVSALTKQFCLLVCTMSFQHATMPTRSLPV